MNAGTIRIYIYVMMDKQGNRWSCVTGETSNTVQVCTLINAADESVYFESKAHHLPAWCRENGINLRTFVEEKSFDEIWNHGATK